MTILAAVIVAVFAGIGYCTVVYGIARWFAIQAKHEQAQREAAEREARIERARRKYAAMERSVEAARERIRSGA